MRRRRYDKYPIFVRYMIPTAQIPLTADPYEAVPENTSAVCSTVPPWENKGRGLAVFNCPPDYVCPPVEHLPDSLYVNDIDCPPDITTDTKRIVLKLSTPDLKHLNALMNKAVLPAFRRCLPLYLFAAFDAKLLTPRVLQVPDKDDVSRTVDVLWPEQLRFLLACMCIICHSPNDLQATCKFRFTPFEKYLFNGLSRAGLPFESHTALDMDGTDFLMRDDHGRLFGLETDGRHFIQAQQQVHDTRLIRACSLTDVIRFSGSELWVSRDACIRRIQAATQPSGKKINHHLPEPLPDLSEEQGACLIPNAGPMLTLAPAGSGKTRVLTRRVVEAVRNGIRPARMLCVVFNKAASLVMSSRIHEEAGLPDIHIRTLHSLGYEICRHAPSGTYNGYEVATAQNLPGGLYRLYREALKRDYMIHHKTLPRPFPEHLVIAYENAVSKHRRTLTPLTDLQFAADHVDFDQDQLLRVFDAVRRTLCTKRLMTYDDQLYYAIETLLTIPRARRHYQHQFDLVLADEVQDMTPVQFFLIRLLAMPQNNLFAVGDDDQMINTFTGADPDNIRAFRTWYPGAALRTLGENYRCAPDIVRQSAHVISYNRFRVEKPIRPAQPDGEGSKAVEIRVCPSLNAEAGVMAHTIKKWLNSGFAPEEIAVLVRVKSLAGLVQAILKEENIPFKPLEDAALYTSPVGKATGAYLDICRDPVQAAPASYADALASPSRYLSNHHLKAASKLGRRFLDDRRTLPAYVQPAIEEFENSIRHLHRRFHQPGLSASAFLNEMIDRFDLAEYFRYRDQISRHPLASTSQDIIDIFCRTAEEFGSPYSFTTAYFQRLMDEQTSIRPSEVRQNEVVITTIHRSKGDEYRGVILFHAAEQTIPHSRMTGTNEDLEEERRVFYVAVTRAIERLCVTTERRYESRFLAELDQPYQIGKTRFNRVGEFAAEWSLVDRVRRLWRRY